jgi:hypothetical protein
MITFALPRACVRVEAVTDGGHDEDCDHEADAIQSALVYGACISR